METSSSVASFFRFTDADQAAAAGTWIFRQGEPGDCMFVVRTGRIDIVVADKTIEQIGPGGVFGELALVDAGPRSAGAVAVEDSTLVRVDTHKFQFLVQQRPFFALEVMKLMAERLRGMNERLVGA
jgi:CRP-like cAMP-binding protein